MNIKQIKNLYNQTYFMVDDMVIDLVLAVTLGGKMPGDPIWLMIIGGSSSGKSEIINIVNDVPFVFQISNLTENSFLSGAGRAGDETSLLHQIGTSGVIVMKDFTSILSMRDDKKDVILGQMREIFDGYITKKTGNRKEVDEWRGKLNFLGGVTDTIYSKTEKSSAMGPRFINYVMPNLNREERLKMLKFASKNANDIKEKRHALQVMVKDFIDEKIQTIPEKLSEIDDDFNDTLMVLSDFVALARTPTERDYKGVLNLINSPEMAPRIYGQFYKLSQYFMYINDQVELSDEHKKLIIKLCLDSLPKQRRVTLRELARYTYVTPKGLGHALRYPTKTARIWLEDLNALGVCERTTSGMNGGDGFIINPEYRTILLQYDNITQLDIGLDSEDDGGYEGDGGGYFSRETNKDPGVQEMLDEKYEELDLNSMF